MSLLHLISVLMRKNFSEVSGLLFLLKYTSVQIQLQKFWIRILEPGA